jgi:DNA polymerase III delta prime subunit
MLVDWTEVFGIVGKRNNHAWLVSLVRGFGVEDILAEFPVRQTVVVRPTVHKNQTTEIINMDDIAGLRELTNGHRELFIVIAGAEKMNQNASNALLKMLEEPTEGVVFVLMSERASSLLPTIRSRCQTLRVRKVADVWAIVDQKRKVTKLKRGQIDFLADGALGMTRELAENSRLFLSRSKSVESAKELLSNDKYAMMKAIFEVKRNKTPKDMAVMRVELAMTILLKLIAKQHNPLMIRKLSQLEQILSKIGRYNANVALLLAGELVA